MKPNDKQEDVVVAARKLLNTINKNARVRYAFKLLKSLADEVERLRKQVKQVERDAREDARGAAAEARWQERQGEDYGSY